MTVPMMAKIIMTAIIPPMILPVVWPLSGRRNSGKLKDKKENAIRPEVDVNSLFKAILQKDW